MGNVNFKTLAVQEQPGGINVFGGGNYAAPEGEPTLLYVQWKRIGLKHTTVTNLNTGKVQFEGAGHSVFNDSEGNAVFSLGGGNALKRTLNVYAGTEKTEVAIECCAVSDDHFTSKSTTVEVKIFHSTTTMFGLTATSNQRAPNPCCLPVFVFATHYGCACHSVATMVG